MTIFYEKNDVFRHERGCFWIMSGKTPQMSLQNTFCVLANLSQNSDNFIAKHLWTANSERYLLAAYVKKYGFVQLARLFWTPFWNIFSIKMLWFRELYDMQSRFCLWRAL